MTHIFISLQAPWYWSWGGWFLYTCFCITSKLFIWI